jgi:hypothetical protein
MLQLDTWTCKSLNKLVKLIDADGQKMLREASADAFEVRIASDYNFGCHAPGKNAVITL